MRPQPFICECRSRRCRRRVRLMPTEYRTLARIGRVLSAECATRESRVVITNYAGYRVVAGHR